MSAIVGALQRIVLIYELWRLSQRFGKQMERVEWAINCHQLDAEMWVVGRVLEGGKSR
jgi:hypothetical protein